MIRARLESDRPQVLKPVEKQIHPPSSLSLLLDEFCDELGAKFNDANFEVSGIVNSEQKEYLLTNDLYHDFLKRRRSEKSCLIITILFNDKECPNTNNDDINSHHDMSNWDILDFIEGEPTPSAQISAQSSQKMDSPFTRNVRKLVSFPKTLVTKTLEAPRCIANKLRGQIRLPEISNLLKTGLYTPQYIKRQLMELSSSLSNNFTKAFTL